ncbi:Endoribonuclease Dcr-1 [Fasciola gigantica]|uniref:Endoribonuclease Dcr-1 n=1 Tax=Fasciola gigantica TaxID=46835 RepID=A0A504Z105_FASGI|nr:Endoribonuclease Dcr-1 [Fasciola gigantica]
MRAALKARQLSNRLSMDPILNQPGVFEFRESDFVNAVVMPGYRNLDQPQHYYVAEIRTYLNPEENCFMIAFMDRPNGFT